MFPSHCRLSILVGFLFTLTSSLAQSPIYGPAGVYAVGDLTGGPTEINALNKDWISGYALRISWINIETLDEDSGLPTYNFSRITSSLEALRAIGKHMTLEIFVSQAPEYIIQMPDTETWESSNGPKVVPWDTNALSAYQAMIEALANHPVEGTDWTIKDHPSLLTIDAPVIGLQGIRENSGALVAVPTYNRPTLIDSIIQSVSISRNTFPDKFGFLAFFRMHDDDRQNPLDIEIYENLMQVFNLPGKPSLGFFQETLSDTGPTAENRLGEILSEASQTTYIMLQALQPWSFQGDISSVPSLNPATGFQLAWNEFGSTYVEIYSSDVLNPNLEQDIRRWDCFFTAVSDIQNGALPIQIETSSPSQQILTWDADPEVAFEVESKVSLTDTQWSTEASGITSGTWTNNSSDTHFYRISPIPPGILWTPESEVEAGP